VITAECLSDGHLVTGRDTVVVTVSVTDAVSLAAVSDTGPDYAVAVIVIAVVCGLLLIIVVILLVYICRRGAARDTKQRPSYYSEQKQHAETRKASGFHSSKAPAQSLEYSQQVFGDDELFEHQDTSRRNIERVNDSGTINDESRYNTPQINHAPHIPPPSAYASHRPQGPTSHAPSPDILNKEPYHSSSSQASSSKPDAKYRFDDGYQKPNNDNNNVKPPSLPSSFMPRGVLVNGGTRFGQGGAQPLKPYKLSEDYGETSSTETLVQAVTSQGVSMMTPPQPRTNKVSFVDNNVDYTSSQETFTTSMPTMPLSIDEKPGITVYY
jgi:hypothetical protein